MMTNREFRWLGTFALLSIGVGLCAGMLAERTLSAPAEAAAGSSQRSSFKFGHRGGRLESVSALADELSLDAAQKTEIERIVAEATATMRHLEAENREIESTAREAVFDVLSTEQKAKLEAKQAKDRDEWRKRELEEEVEGFSIVLDLSPEESDAFRAALAAAHKKKDEFFRERCRDGGKPEKEEVRAFFDTWRVEKTEALRRALAPAKFEKYSKVEKCDLFDGGR